MVPPILVAAQRADAVDWQALERERGELTEQLAIYQATLDLTPREHTARRESLMWQIRRVWKRSRPRLAIETIPPHARQAR
jgi:hypothetical protein